MKEINGLKYSREVFDGYKYRAKIKLNIKDDYHNLDIYTTDGTREGVLNMIHNCKSKKVTSVELLNWSSKEQDDLASEFIDEWLNKIL